MKSIGETDLSEVQAIERDLPLADSDKAPSVTALAASSAELGLYGVVGLDVTAVGMRAALAMVGDRDLTIRIASPGGKVFDGLAMFAMLSRHKGHKTVVVEGLAGSAASFVAMAGDTIEMGASSFMMIHNSRSVAMGDRHTLAETAAINERIDGAMAGIYAARTGLPRDEIAAMMDEETWMTAAEAVQRGFASVVTDDLPAPNALTPDALCMVAALKNAPEAIMAMARAATPPAVPAQHQEVTLTIATIPAGPAPADATATSAIATPPAQEPHVTTNTPVAATLEQIQAVAARANLGSDFIVAQLAARSSPAAVADAAIDAIAQGVPQRAAGINAVMRDGRVDARENMEHALMARAGLKGYDPSRAQAYAGMSLVEIARESISAVGGSSRGMDRNAIAGAALGMPNFMAAAGLHTTSDFPQVLANVARKSLLAGYNAVSPVWRQLARVVSHSDYKPVAYARMGEAPALLKTAEHQPYTYGTMAERGTAMAVEKWGRLIGVTREVIINDDLGAFTRLPQSFGYAAADTIQKQFWATLVANPVMSDGVALFHANHGNLAGSGTVINTASISAARRAMRVQKGIDGRAIQVAPKYLIVSPDKETEAQTFLATVQNADYSAAIFANSLTLVVTPELTGNVWYLAADPAALDTIYVAFLNGREEPRIEERMGFEVDGMEIKAAIDFGVAPIDWVGLYKNPGA
jgi:ATP-dependent protease ClpP protease subunit/phage major head subunit gpT-like protein